MSTNTLGEGEMSEPVSLAHDEAHDVNAVVDTIARESRSIGVKKTAQEVADFLLGTPRPAANTAAVAQQQLLDDVDISRHTVTNSEDDPNVRVLVDLEKKYAGNLEKLAKVRNLSVVERGGSRCMRFEKENFNLGLEDEQAETPKGTAPPPAAPALRKQQEQPWAAAGDAAAASFEPTCYLP